MRRPIADVFGSGDAVTFQFDMPGVASSDIDASLERDTLKVSTHAELSEGNRGELALQEFAPANFAREFVLSSDIDRDNIQAYWRDGVLTLVVPEAAQGNRRKI